MNNKKIKTNKTNIKVELSKLIFNFHFSLFTQLLVFSY